MEKQPDYCLSPASLLLIVLQVCSLMCKCRDDSSHLLRVFRGLNEVMYAKHIAEQLIFQQTSFRDYILNKVYIRTRLPLPTVPFLFFPLPEQQGVLIGRSCSAPGTLTSNEKLSSSLKSVFFVSSWHLWLILIQGVLLGELPIRG